MEFYRKINEMLLPRVAVLSLPKQTIAELSKMGDKLVPNFDLDRIVENAIAAYSNKFDDKEINKFSEIPICYYKPSDFNIEPIVFALKRMKFFVEEIGKRKLDLPEDKELQIITAFGLREIIICQISVVSNTDLEIKGLDGEGFVTILMPYSNLSLMFREVDEFKLNTKY